MSFDSQFFLDTSKGPALIPELLWRECSCVQTSHEEYLSQKTFRLRHSTAQPKPNWSLVLTFPGRLLSCVALIKVACQIRSEPGFSRAQVVVVGSFADSNTHALAGPCEQS
jgi:hypothetical protein